jgi:hypothetical protein
MQVPWRAEADVLGGCAAPILPQPGSPRLFMPAAISDQKPVLGKDEKTGTP